MCLLYIQAHEFWPGPFLYQTLILSADVLINIASIALQCVLAHMPSPTAALLQNKTFRKINSCVTKFRIIYTIICRLFLSFFMHYRYSQCWGITFEMRPLHKCRYVNGGDWFFSIPSRRRWFWSPGFPCPLLFLRSNILAERNNQIDVAPHCPTLVISLWFGSKKCALCVIAEEGVLEGASTVLCCCVHGRWIATRWIIAAASDKMRFLWRIV